jgi:nitrogen regulatory protein PII
MKMLMIVFRESLEEEILRLLKELGVKAFTELPSVVGAGEAGAAFHSFTSPGANSIVLTALSEDQTDRVVKGLHAYRDQLSQRQHGAAIPLRAFILPCEQVVRHVSRRGARGNRQRTRELWWHPLASCHAPQARV